MIADRRHRSGRRGERQHRDVAGNPAGPAVLMLDAAAVLLLVAIWLASHRGRPPDPGNAIVRPEASVGRGPAELEPRRSESGALLADK